MNCPSYHSDSGPNAPQNHPDAIAERDSIQWYESLCEQGDSITAALESLERTHEAIRFNKAKESI